MAQLFNFSPQSLLHYIFGNKVLISSLLEVIVNMDSNEVYWPQMIALCLYAQFLLVSSFDNCNSKVLYILDQVEAGLDPFPLILAKTIVGLDNFAKTRRFSGSPLLLEVSFSFHFLFTAFPFVTFHFVHS